MPVSNSHSAGEVITAADINALASLANANETAITTKASTSSVNNALAAKADLVGGVVPSSQLPSATSDATKANVDLSNVTPATGRSALGLGSAATQPSSAFEVAGAAAAAQAASQPVDSDLTAIAALTTTVYGRAFLALADAAAGRTALGLGTAATTAATAYEVAGAAAAAQAASQPLDSDLTAIAALTTTAYGRALLALADAAAGRTAFGLGTAATANTGTSAGNVPVLDGSGQVAASVLNNVGKYDTGGSSYNITESSFRNWRQALAKQRNHEGAARIVWIGDSTTAGANLTTPATQNVVARARQVLAGRFGSGPISDGFELIDHVAYSSITRGTGWNNFSQAGQSGIGNLAYASAGAAGTLDYSPPSGAAWDTAEVIFHRQACVTDVWIGSGTHTTVTVTGGSGIVKATVTGSLDVQALHVGNVASGQARVANIAVYDSTANPDGLMVSNWGVNGADTGQFVFGSATPSATDSVFGPLLGTSPNLVVINLGLNDAKVSSPVPVQTYYDRIAAAITILQAAAVDVLLIVPPAYNPTDVSVYGDHSGHDAKLYALADTFNVGLFDMTRRWGPYATYNAKGYGGYPHPNARSYWDEAQGLVDVLVRTA